MISVDTLFGYYQSQAPVRADGTAEITAAAVLAHPDDEIILSNVIAKARKYGICMVDMTLSRGEASTKNHRAEDAGFDLVQGSRGQEAREGAISAGFTEHHQFDGTDGNLAQDAPWLVSEVAGLLIAREVDLVLSISQMTDTDSYDHTVAGMVGNKAAGIAAEALGHVGMLQIQPNGQGEWCAESTPDSLAIVSKIASANDSQFRIGPADDRPSHWAEVSPGFVMHPADWAELNGLYPITGISTHSYVQCGRLLVPEAVEV